MINFSLNTCCRLIPTEMGRRDCRKWLIFSHFFFCESVMICLHINLSSLPKSLGMPLYKGV